MKWKESNAQLKLQLRTQKKSSHIEFIDFHAHNNVASYYIIYFVQDYFIFNYIILKYIMKYYFHFIIISFLL